MSVTEFSYNPQSSSPAIFSAQADGFNAELQARMDDIELFGDYVDRRAEDASGHSVWVSSASYNDGDVVYSPTDWLPYRANKDIAVSTTDPSADGGTDWVAAGGVSAAQQTKLDYMTVTEAVDLDAIAINGEFTADGAITAGDVVVLKTATGKVASVTESGVAESAGTPVEVSSLDYNFCQTAYDPDNSCTIIAYEDATGTDSLDFRAVTVSGSTPTISGTIAATTTDTQAIGVCMASAGTITVMGFENRSVSDYPYAIALTYNGTTGSLGTALQLKAIGSNASVGVCYDSVNDQFITAYTSTSGGWVQAVTYSGTALTGNTEAQFESGSCNYSNIAYDPVNQECVVAFGDVADSYKMKACVVQISGTTLTPQTAVTLETGAVYALTICYGGGVFLIGYRDFDSTDMNLIAVKINGTTLDVGTAVAYANTDGSQMAISYDSDRDEFCLFYPDSDNSGYTSFRMITVNSSTLAITQGSKVVVESASYSYHSSVYDQSQNKHVGFYAGSTAEAVVISPTSIVSDNTDWLGIAQASVADTETVEVLRQGRVDENQSGLTIGATYYVDGDGALTTDSEGGANPKIGKAVAADKLYITEEAA
jgi:hypothetical protein